ncbi:hypothetical protein D9615_002695 [Tricholomella constricta]|uniref:Uncharacterized protein n=1 Tax=Tricholomella constricta TaxID=117010 RepID=A0A8H5M9S9_9AGAR|nr:hypothetical protein D9615_002695 [Tricholomella constricta]
MTVFERAMEERSVHASHAHVGSTHSPKQARRDDPPFAELKNKHDQSACTMSHLMSTACLTKGTGALIRRALTTPSECTCNIAFFNIWSACLLSDGETLPLYEDWISECQNKPVAPESDYPKKNAEEVEIPKWATISVPDNLTFDWVSAIQATDSSTPWGVSQIMAPVAALLGTLVICAVAFFVYRSRSGGRNPFPLRWGRVQKVRRVNPADRNIAWSIDRTEATDEFVMVDVEDGQRANHDRLPSGETIKTMNSLSVWKNSQIAQQIRRLPDQLPIPWKERAVQITSQPPGKRFRVDSSNTSSESGGANSTSNSHPGTAEGGIRPDTIFEEDEYPETEYRNSMYGDEETSLISPVERSENHVFLITGNRSIDFTLSSSSNSNSGTSHVVKVVPPTPTESSRLSHNRLTVTIPPPIVKPPLHAKIPPEPREPAPLPPRFTVPSLQRGPSPSPHPLPQPGPSNAHSAQPNGNVSQPPPSGNLHHTPRPVLQDVPPASNVRRQLSQDEDDPLKRNLPLPQARPMGARLPSSPRHAARQLSLDDELNQNTISPSVQSLESMSFSPAYSQRPLTPSSHRRGYSGDDTPPSQANSLTAPPLMHNRNLSIESIVPSRGDPVMLFPGPVRAAGYLVSLSEGASESSASLYSTTSSGNPRSLPSMAQPRERT